MRTFFLLVSLLPLVAACASAPKTVPAAEAPPSENARSAFFDALKRLDDDAALALLRETPGLSQARTRSGHSAYLASLVRVSGVGFVKPQANRLAAAILALHPPLDAFESCAAGDVAAVEAELARDASFVRRANGLGWTPLHVASFAGQVRVVELLLARGAAIDAVAANRFGNTPLQVALLTVQREVARVLVEHRANVNFKQNEGVTALHEAAQGGDVEIVRMLLDAGADPAARTGRLDDGREGVSPLELAQKAGRDEVVALLRARGG